MSSLQQSLSCNCNEIKSYSVPKLHTGKDWYIGFNAYDPISKKMKRKKIKVNHIEKIGQRRRYSDGVIKRLLVKLERGWNPWVESEDGKSYKTFNEACDHYKKYIFKLLNDGILREDTHRDYSSKIKNIIDWNNTIKVPIYYIYQLDREFITDFLEEIYIGRKNSAQTRNNYLTFIRIFCSFLLENQYVKVKPSDGISSINKRKLKKQRTVIEEKDIIRLFDYLSTHNKNFLLACYILHYCFVRRKEMSLLKLSYFNLKNQTLFIPGDISKNGESATVTIPEKIIHLMIDLKIFEHPSHYFLFSDNFKPGANHKHEKQFTDYWAYHVRKDLKFPASYQFYSLKDTGITDMLQRYDVLTVRDQARHSDIKMTNKYTPSDRKTANPLLTNHNGIF